MKINPNLKYPENMEIEIRAGQCPACGREGQVINFMTTEKDIDHNKGRCYPCLKAEGKRKMQDIVLENTILNDMVLV